MNYDELPLFIQGYIEALFFTSESPRTTEEWLAHEQDGTNDGELPCDVGFNEFHPDALAAIIKDCGRFQVEASALLAHAYDRDYDVDQAGRDFWFTRNGHGVGFWDRSELDAEDLGDLLSKVARSFGEVYAYLGDDGAIHYGSG